MRSNFIRNASNAWLREQLNHWREVSLVGVPWFWFRDVLEEAHERGLCTINHPADGSPFYWSMSQNSYTILS